PAERVAPPLPAAVVDPLAGDWSEGLRGPLRALGIPEPKLIPLDGLPQPVPPPPRPVAPAPAEVVEAPDAWAAAAEDTLESRPPRQRRCSFHRRRPSGKLLLRQLRLRRARSSRPRT